MYNYLKPLVVLVLLSLPEIAMGQGKKNPVVSTLKVHKVLKDKNGKELRAPADSAMPGDVLEYELLYKNNTDKDVNNLAPFMKIPENTEYIDGSAGASLPAIVEFSIDSGKTYRKPPIFKEIFEKGKKKKVKISPEEYTNIKWILKGPLKPESEVKFYFRVKVK